MKKSESFRRALTLLLAASMAASLVSCGGDTVTSTDTTAASDVSADTTEAVDPSKVCDLPDMDWKGEEFHVLGYAHPVNTQFSTFEVWVESENGEVLNDAIFKRNMAVSDAMGVEIKQIYT